MKLIRISILSVLLIASCAYFNVGGTGFVNRATATGSVIGPVIPGATYTDGTNNYVLNNTTTTVTPIVTPTPTGTEKPKDPTQKKADATQAMIDSANTAALALKWIYMLLIPILALIGKFMTNDWVVGNVLNIDTVIGVIWQYVRNLVNISMMLYLLYLAGINIVSVGNMDFKKDIKTQLPKVAGVLIAVNFSFLLCRSIIGLAGAVTTATFGIPSQIGSIVQTTMGADEFPLIWVEALGEKKIKDNNGNIEAKSDSTFVLECIHKNYALTMSSIQNEGLNGKMIIANPVFNDVTKTYTKAWYDDYRRIIKGERYTRENGQPVSNPKFLEQVKAAKQDVATNAKAGVGGLDTVKYVNNPVELKKELDAKTATSKMMYPYYSDCVTDWNDLMFSERNAMFIFAFNLMKVGEYENGLANISSVSDLLTRGVFSIVYLGMFFLVAIAMALAVMIRGIMLWFMMAMSPIWITTKIIGNFGIKELDKLGSLELFASLAFMPAVLGFVLSMSFMMINYIKYIGKSESLDAGRFPLGALNIYYDANNPILGGVNSIFDMMIATLTVVAVWMAVKFAFDFGFKKTEGTVFGKLYENTVGKVTKMGDTIGQFAASAPLKMPFIPMGNSGKLSLEGLSRLGDAHMQSLSSKFGQDDNDTLKVLTGNNFTMAPEKANLISGNFKTNKNNATLEQFHKNMSPLDATNDTDKEFAHSVLKEIVSHKGEKFTMKDPNGTDIEVSKVASTALHNKYMAKKIEYDTILQHVASKNSVHTSMVSQEAWGKVNDLLTNKQAVSEDPYEYDNNGNIKDTSDNNKLVDLSNLTAVTGYFPTGTTTNKQRLDKIKIDLTAEIAASRKLSTSSALIQSALNALFDDAKADNATKQANLLSKICGNAPTLANIKKYLS